MDVSLQVTVNQDGCDSSHMCSYIAMVVWALTGPPSSTLSCSTIRTSGQSPTWMNRTCEAKVPNRTFKSGATTPIACESDSDCALADDTDGRCYCTMTNTGKGICIPDHSNDVIFSGYWNECGADNIIDSEAAYNYWTYYEVTWIFENSGLPCTWAFAESQQLDKLFKAYNASLADDEEGSAILAMEVVGISALLA